MIELMHVCAGYEKKQILHDVSMRLEPGKVTVLVGPNGCGKSTLLKTLVGILKHTSGRILVNGEAVETFTPARLARHVAYLPQSKKAPELSVLRMVLHGRFAYLNYPRRYREEDFRIAREALRWVGMEDKEEEMVSRLSGGMQQKVYLAMALAQDADTILMDEPTTYLDIAHQLRVMEMAKKLAKEGKAVVMVLHDLSQALRTADHVILLHEGRLKRAGTPEEIYQSGELEQIFGVKIDRIWRETGWHYFHFL